MWLRDQNPTCHSLFHHHDAKGLKVFPEEVKYGEDAAQLPVPGRAQARWG